MLKLEIVEQGLIDKAVFKELKEMANMRLDSSIDYGFTPVRLPFRINGEVIRFANG